MILSSGLGLDFDSLVSSVTSAGKDLITKELPAAATAAVTKQAAKAVAPIAQQQAKASAAQAYSKGSVALLGAAGLGLGALVAGGSWKRRAVAGVAVGALAAGIGFKFGLQLTGSYS